MGDKKPSEARIRELMKDPRMSRENATFAAALEEGLTEGDVVTTTRDDVESRVKSVSREK